MPHDWWKSSAQDLSAGMTAHAFLGQCQVQGLRIPPLPPSPGTDISLRLFHPQEREQITETDSTAVPWQARLAQSHGDETSRQHNTGLFRGIHACFFNLDVPFCFCVLHPPAASENTRAIDSLASPPSSHPLITPLPNKAAVSKAVCYQRTSYLNLWHQREEEETVRGGNRGSHWKRGGWIDGWRGDSQRDDRRWIKGEIERGRRHRAVWHRQTVLFCCLWAPRIALCVTPTMLWTKYTAISQHRQARHTHIHTHFETQAL